MEEESSCPPYQYIDILISRKEYGQLLHFYDLCPENRWYLDRQDKIELLSNQFGIKFGTFNDFVEYYSTRMIKILSDDEAIEFAAEFTNPFVIQLLNNKLKDTDLILRKFRVATFKEDYNRVAKLAKLLYAKRGDDIYLGDLMTAKNLKKTEEVINRALGTHYNFQPQKYARENYGDLKRIIFLLGNDNINNNLTGIEFLSKYNYHEGGTEEEFRDVIRTARELLRRKPELEDKIIEALSHATLSERMRKEADQLGKYVLKRPSASVHTLGSPRLSDTETYGPFYSPTPPDSPRLSSISVPDPLTSFRNIFNNNVEIDNVNPNDLPSILLAADEIADSVPYDPRVIPVIKLILSRIRDFSFIWSIRTQLFRHAIEDYLANK